MAEHFVGKRSVDDNGFGTQFRFRPMREDLGSSTLKLGWRRRRAHPGVIVPTRQIMEIPLLHDDHSMLRCSAHGHEALASAARRRSRKGHFSIHLSSIRASQDDIRQRASVPHRSIRSRCGHCLQMWKTLNLDNQANIIRILSGLDSSLAYGLRKRGTRQVQQSYSSDQQLLLFSAQTILVSASYLRRE